MCVCVLGGALSDTVLLQKQNQLQMDERWIHSQTIPLSECATLFFFFSTRKMLQLAAHRLYFPRMNFKRLPPLPLKASCSLRLRFMLFIQMKKTHFSFKRPSFSDVFKKKKGGGD